MLVPVPSAVHEVHRDDDIRCQSINQVVHGEICELNNRTKEARPEYFTDDHTKVYMKKFRKRGRWRRFAKCLVSLFSRTKLGFLVGYSMKAVSFSSGSSIISEKNVALFWKEALKQGIIERFDKTSSRIRPSSKLNIHWKNHHVREGKLIQNLLLFHRVLHLIYLSNVNLRLRNWC